MENIKSIKKTFISKISNLIKKNKYKEVFKNILYYPVKVIGEGVGGEVVEVQNLEGETAALKIMENGSILEYEIGVIAGDALIGPCNYSFTKLRNNYSYILMEEIKGQPLDEINVTADTLRHILDLYYSLYTKHGIIHNDLKAQNIIYLDPKFSCSENNLSHSENKIKIIDYGEARIYNAHTYGYTSPAKLEHEVSQREGSAPTSAPQTRSLFDNRDTADTFDIENHMMRMASLLINSLTFEYNKYNKTGKENIYFNLGNSKENNTCYFIRLYNSAMSWLIYTFEKKNTLDINYDACYIDINFIQCTNPEIPLSKIENRFSPSCPTKKPPVLYRRRPSISSEHTFKKKNILGKNLFY